MSEDAARPVPARPLPLQTKKESASADGESWVLRIRWVALAVFAAVPLIGFSAPRIAGRVVWTIVIAALPLFIVLVGYHRWRRLCPLAFVNQIPVMLRRPGARRVPARIETNATYLSFAVFFLSLWARLVATNGSGSAIAFFFILIALAALVTGVLYTGKTWCNYVCPLAFIEKIYTEPTGLRETSSSQCTKCTACKSACPDINEENGYWKEIDSRSKRFAYYAFPGIVFAFYFYYYLQSGTWDYYFGGRWTNEPDVVRSAFLPGVDASTAGFYFLPAVPRALAAALTLAALSFVSFLLFSWLEPRVGIVVRKRQPAADSARVRSITFAIASFTAFVTFYTFAGQPTLRKIPWAPQIAGVLVVATATLFLVRRLGRTPQDFAEQTLAKGILKRWEWSVDQPRDGRDAYLIHNLLARERKKNHAKMLAAYREAMREAVADRLVDIEDLDRFESMRTRLGITTQDHRKIVADLVEEERARPAGSAGRGGVEKRLQMETYERVLERHLREALAAGGSRDAEILRQLRQEYGVTEAEHAAVLERLMGANSESGARLAEGMARLERDARTCRLLEGESNPARIFLADLLRRARRRAVERLLLAFNSTFDQEAIRVVSDGLCSSAEDLGEAALSSLRAHFPPGIAASVIEARRRAATIDGQESDSLVERLAGLTASGDPHVRAAALHLLILEGRASAEIAGRLERDESEIVRETAKGASDRGTPASLTSIERMIALRSVPLFATLAPEPLSDLAASCGEASFAPGTTLCREGDPSREVFVLLAGDVIVVHGDGLEEVVFATEGTGSVLGEMAVLNRAPRSATVRAGANGARVLVLDGEGFRQSIYDDPTIADAVIHTLARRLGAADDVIRSLASARERGGAQDGASLRDPRSDRKAAGC